MKNYSQSLVCIVVCILGFLTAGLSSFLFPDFPLVWQISLGVAVLAIFAFSAVEKEMLARVLAKRTTQYGLNSAFMALVGIAIFVVVNLIGVEHDIKKDFTKNKLHSLSEQSIKIVQNLQTPVKLLAFVQPNQQHEYQRVFERYTYISKMFQPSFIDTDRDPLAPRKYNIKSWGTMIIESANRTTRIENIYSPDDPKIEEKITNAIIQVVKGDKKKICFLIGHGEQQISDSSPQGFSEMKENLENSRYKTEELVLLDKERVPESCEMIVSVGPKSDFPDKELGLIENYLKSGGKVFILLKPFSTVTLQPFLAKYGIDWKPLRSVFERNPFNQLADGQPVTPMVSNYDSGHEITKDFRGQPSMFIIPAPIEKQEKAPEGYKVSSLFSTSARSFEVTFQGNRVVADERTARKGPISLAVSVSGKATLPSAATPSSANSATAENKGSQDKGKDEKNKDKDKDKNDSEFRLVVVGDTEFASNNLRRFGQNADLFQNMMSWLAKEEDLIAIRPKATDAGEFQVTLVRARIITLATMFFFPLAMFVAGIGVWLVRRRR